jgi:hypothetical protein
MKYIIIGSILTSLLITQFIFLYAFEKRQKQSINVFYNDPVTSFPVSYEKKYTIYTPRSNSEKYPVAILLHGDIVNEKSMNLLKNEFIYSGFMVVLVRLDFTYQSYLELEAITNYLAIRPDVDNSQIGIVGHSHGGHFAFWFAKTHDHLISSVIMANMGSFRQLYEDYYEYYNYFVNTAEDISLYDYLANFSESITSDNPRNLLIITDFYQPIRSTEVADENLIAWQFEEENVVIGDFSNGSARELNTQYKMFFHGSGIFNPNTIQKEIDWMRNSLGVNGELNPLIQIAFRIYGFFVLMIIIIVLASIILINGLNTIPFQLSWIKNRLYKYRQKKIGNAEMEIPRVLPLKIEHDNKMDALRLERRFSREFDFIHDVAEYFRIIVIVVIGTHLLLYLLQLMIGDNALYYVEQNGANGFFNSIFAFNDRLNSILFTHPLSFTVMYFWILIVFFFRRLRIKDPRLQKQKINIIDVPNMIILTLEIFGMFWIFGFLTISQWLGFNFFESGLNVLLRFAVLFFIHFSIVEFAYYQSSKPEKTNKFVYIVSILFILMMYLPLTIPSIDILFHAFKYAPYFLSPYLFVVTLIVGFSIFGRKNAFEMTIATFFFLLFWKYNIYYLILF